LWLMAHDWSQNRCRTFLWLSFLLFHPVHLALLGWVGGGAMQATIAAGFLIAPAGILGGWMGNALGQNLSRSRLRTAMIVVLCGIAAYAILQPWLTPSSASAASATDRKSVV